MVTIVSRATWGAVAANRSIQVISSTRRTGFVVHHSVSGTGLNPMGARALIRSFQRSHQSNGWGDIGYNFLIDAWGNIYEGRGLAAIGAHAGGHNTLNLGVCYIGDGRTGEMPELAKQAFRNLYAWLNAQAGKTLTRLVHSDLNSTACPGPFIRDWVKAGGLSRGNANTLAQAPAPTPKPQPKIESETEMYFLRTTDGTVGLVTSQGYVALRVRSHLALFERMFAAHPGWDTFNSAERDVMAGYIRAAASNGTDTERIVSALAAIKENVDVASLTKPIVDAVRAAIAAQGVTVDLAPVLAAVTAATASINANVDQIPLGFTITAK